MATTTRNAFKGNIETIEKNGDTATIGVLVENNMIYAIISLKEVDDLDLWQGRPGHILFDEDTVSFATNYEELEEYADRNKFTGKVVEYDENDGITTVVIETPGLLKIYGSMWRAEGENLEVKIGDTVTAVVRKEDVRVTTPDFMPDTE